MCRNDVCMVYIRLGIYGVYVNSPIWDEGAPVKKYLWGWGPIHLNYTPLDWFKVSYTIFEVSCLIIVIYMNYNVNDNVVTFALDEFT